MINWFLPKFEILSLSGLTWSHQ